MIDLCGTPKRTFNHELKFDSLRSIGEKVLQKFKILYVNSIDMKFRQDKFIE